MTFSSVDVAGEPSRVRYLGRPEDIADPVAGVPVPERLASSFDAASRYPHINWLCSNLLGIPWRGVGKFGAAAKSAGGGETRDTPVESAERAEMSRLARAGLRGTRRWIQWLTARGEDPPWSRPVPGEDQAAWGYPITLQLFGPSADADVALRLCIGKRGGAEIPCHFSSPRRPSNPAVVPRATYCLIPKATLAPGTTYTEVASGLPENAEFAWSFTTGAK